MKTVCLVLCFVASAAAIFWPLLGPGFGGSQQPTFTKLCLYSVDPSQFMPMCIMCPNTLYPIVLQTCVRGIAIPSNVSFTQANCIVANCAVVMSRKKRSESDSSEKGITKLLVLPSMVDQEEVNDSGAQSSDSSLPYVMEVQGINVTVTAEEEYFVHLDQKKDDEEDEEDDSSTL